MTTVVATVEVPRIGEIDPRRLGLVTEAKLVDWGLEYTYDPVFDTSAVRVAEWAQVRDERSLADKTSLDEFKTQMREGSVYPPVVIMHPDVLIDGNHRFNASKVLRRKSILAFVVQFP